MRNITLDPTTGEFVASILCTDTEPGGEPVRVTEWFEHKRDAERFANSRYWVLLAGAYPDVQSEYVAASSLEHATALARHYYDGYSDFGGAHVYRGTRAPWTEQDPYPDYVIYQGPRGGMAVERA